MECFNKQILTVPHRQWRELSWRVEKFGPSRNTCLLLTTSPSEQLVLKIYQSKIGAQIERENIAWLRNISSPHSGPILYLETLSLLERIPIYLPEVVDLPELDNNKTLVLRRFPGLTLHDIFSNSMVDIFTKHQMLLGLCRTLADIHLMTDYIIEKSNSTYIYPWNRFDAFQRFKTVFLGQFSTILRLSLPSAALELIQIYKPVARQLSLSFMSFYKDVTLGNWILDNISRSICMIDFEGRKLAPPQWELVNLLETNCSNSTPDFIDEGARIFFKRRFAQSKNETQLISWQDFCHILILSRFQRNLELSAYRARDIFQTYGLERQRQIDAFQLHITRSLSLLHDNEDLFTAILGKQEYNRLRISLLTTIIWFSSHLLSSVV
jgi:hypothetical protein